MMTMIMNDWAAEHWLACEPAELTCSLRRSSSPARPRPPEPTSRLFLIFLIKYLTRVSHYKTLSISSPAPQFESNNHPYLTFLITSFSYSLTSFSFPHPTPIFLTKNVPWVYNVQLQYVKPGRRDDGRLRSARHPVATAPATCAAADALTRAPANCNCGAVNRPRAPENTT